MPHIMPCCASSQVSRGLDADSAKQDAESAKAEYESHLLTARTEAEEITARAVKNAQTR